MSGLGKHSDGIVSLTSLVASSLVIGFCVLRKLNAIELFFFPNEDYLDYIKTNNNSKRENYAKGIFSDPKEGQCTIIYIIVARKMVLKI